MKTQIVLGVLGVLSIGVAGCSSDDDATPGARPGAAGAGTSEAAALTLMITGTLKGDEATSKATHDAIVGGSREQAAKLGDIAHGVYLTAGDKKTFLAFDRWTSKDGLNTFFGNPDVAKGFGQLFSAPPERTVWRPRTEWTHWGDAAVLSSGQHFVFTIRGQVKGTEADSRTAHNQLVDQAREQAAQLGDIFHAVFVGEDDPTQTLGVDVWTNLEGAQKFFSDPNFQKGSVNVYAAPPVVKAWGATNWAQW